MSAFRLCFATSLVGFSLRSKVLLTQSGPCVKVCSTYDASTVWMTHRCRLPPTTKHTKFYPESKDEKKVQFATKLYHHAVYLFHTSLISESMRQQVLKIKLGLKGLKHISILSALELLSPNKCRSKAPILIHAHSLAWRVKSKKAGQLPIWM